MSDPQRLDDLEDHSPADDVAGSVLAVGVVGLDVEVCVITRLGGQGGLESRQKRSAGSWRGWLGGGARLTGTHTLGAAHIMRLHAEGRRGGLGVVAARLGQHREECTQVVVVVYHQVPASVQARGRGVAQRSAMAQESVCGSGNERLTRSVSVVI
jgi:hypothetical protein